MKNRTLVVDSSYLLQRSYHGAKNVSTKKFGHIGGLYSFMTRLRQLITKHRANKVILAWDGENGGLFRHNIDPAYKANRKDKKWNEKIELSPYELKREKEKEQSLLKQKKRIQSYAEELFLRQIEVDEIEADDLIAAYCIENHNIEDIILYTNDRDFVQLLDLNIEIHFDNIETIIDKSSFFLEFPYYYKNALTLKIICGDSSDNIQGIAGLKERTLLKHFPELKKRYVTVKEICSKADKINEDRLSNKKKKLKALNSLTENVDRLKTNFQLINLREPLLNEEAEEELELLKYPLSDEDRNSKNLYNMMMEDEFLTIYNGRNFVEYVQPFYLIIQNEKKFLKKYLKSEKKRK